MKHYIYKVTCKTTRKFYIGMRSSSDEDYTVRSKRLKLSIDSHSKNNHEFEILEYCEDKESMRKKRVELVKIASKDPMYMTINDETENRRLNPGLV